MSFQRKFARSQLKKHRAATATAAKDLTGRWNYEPVHALRGSVIIGKALRPTWWSAPFEGQRRKCVKVSYQGGDFFLDDESGDGSRKVFQLGGGPDAPHASIHVDDLSSFIAE